MTEDFLHFVWKYGLFDRNSLFTDQQENVKVIHLGEHNTDAGPDFLNARIMIGNTLWAGNVEVHLRSSDWYRHNHQFDKAYDNVILQVVYEHDRQILRTNNEPIPSLELKFSNKLFDNYTGLMSSIRTIPCAVRIRNIDPIVMECWMNALVVERIRQKSDAIAILLNQNKNNWEETFYVFLARSFGSGINHVPFELLAKSFPLKFVSKHKDDLFRLEALLFGQAGFLDSAEEQDDYYALLKKEYQYLQKKYNLIPIEKHLWKFLRIRPLNFPTIRIGQLAAVLCQSPGLFSRILECRTAKEVIPVFNNQPSDYWKTHYTFGNDQTEKKSGRMGERSIHLLLINTVIPFLFIYGMLTGREILKERAMEWLADLPPEQNRMISEWKKLGFKPSSAFYTQGLIQLTRNYCYRKKCLACSAGIRIISSIPTS